MNITFQELEFRDTPYAYMDKHGLPSGGDCVTTSRSDLVWRNRIMFNKWVLFYSIIDGICFLYNSNCDLPKGITAMTVEYNDIYTQSGLINGNGNVCNMTFTEWQAKGNDPGTTISSIPSDQEIIAMTKKLLDNNKTFCSISDHETLFFLILTLKH